MFVKSSLLFILYMGILVESLESFSYSYCQAPGIVPSIETDGKSLQFVQAISRHGDRSPTRVLPHIPTDNVAWECTLNELTIPSNDSSLSEPIPSRLYRKLCIYCTVLFITVKYINDRELLYPGNCALGQLTTLGLQQTTTLGTQLRELYVDQYSFLPAEFDAELIYVRSTDVPRTIQSAEGQFLGMYPPSAASSSVEVIPINTMDIGLEDMFPNPVICPLLQTVYDELTNSTAWEEYMAETEPLEKKLQSIFNTTEQLDFQQLSDALLARQCHDLPFPEGITDQIVAELLNASNWQQSFLYNDPIAGPLGAGLFLQELVDAIDAFIAGKTAPIYILYSGHDSTLAPLLGNLGVYDNLWPPYASNLQIELWRDDSAQPPYTAEDYYVEMKYNSQYLQLSVCSSVMCNYGQSWRPFALTRVPTASDCGALPQPRFWNNLY